LLWIQLVDLLLTFDALLKSRYKRLQIEFLPNAIIRLSIQFPHQRLWVWPLLLHRSAGTRLHYSLSAGRRVLVHRPLHHLDVRIQTRLIILLSDAKCGTVSSHILAVGAYEAGAREFLLVELRAPRRPKRVGQNAAGDFLELSCGVQFVRMYRLLQLTLTFGAGHVERCQQWPRNDLAHGSNHLTL
jgi:hypothetical protein